MKKKKMKKVMEEQQNRTRDDTSEEGETEQTEDKYNSMMSQIPPDLAKQFPGNASDDEDNDS